MNGSLKKHILLITYTVLLFFSFKYLSLIWDFFNNIFLLLNPFIYGFILAYLINWPFSFLSSKIKDLKLFKNREKLSKIVSLILSYMFFFCLVSFIIIIIVPQLIMSTQSLVNNSAHYFKFFEETYKSILLKFNFGNWSLSDVIENFLSTQSQTVPQNIFTKAFGFVKNFTLIIYNFTIGIVASIYFLFNKEKLILQVKKLLFVSLPKKYYQLLRYIIGLSHDYFGRFIIGKLIDSVIIGFLCFIGTTLLCIPYAILISTVIGITNIIPFFGPFLGAIPSIMILFVISPVKAITFSIFILALQQIDGNIIGPRILGKSIGISGMFIMFSVVIGGGIFGVPGMLLGVPIFAVIYTVLSKLINNRYEKLKK